MDIHAISKLIRQDLEGATTTLQLAATHADPETRLHLLDRAWQRFDTARQACQRHQLQEFGPQLRSLEQALARLKQDPGQTISNF